jgi:hypothetical protein
LAPYEPYPAIEDIDHFGIKDRSPRSNGICERFHKTIVQKSYPIAFRKNIYDSLDELQADLDT